MIKYVAMSGVIYLKIQNRFREFSQGGAAATAGASVVSGLVVGSVACAQSRALEDDPDGPPRDRRCGREWGRGADFSILTEEPRPLLGSEGRGFLSYFV